MAGLKLASVSWSQISVEWRQPFFGTAAQARRWARSNTGTELLLQKIERAQNAFVDIAKREFSSNYDVHCVRHFGPLDWPLFQLVMAGTRVVDRIGSSFGSHFRSIPASLEVLPSVCRQVSFEQRTLQRAVDLSQCGYPTESVLLAAAVLDAFVQKFLSLLMADKHIKTESSEQLLRNVTTRRLLTYLDAVLKLASGRSLSEDHHALFQRMIKVNSNRNDAIHNGKELSRIDAYEACRVAYEVIRYLCGIRPGVMPELKEPVFFA
jgi:hypothetical protein